MVSFLAYGSILAMVAIQSLLILSLPLLRGSFGRQDEISTSENEALNFNAISSRAFAHAQELSATSSSQLEKNLILSNFSHVEGPFLFSCISLDTQNPFENVNLH